MPIEAGYPKKREHLPKYGKHRENPEFRNSM